jgi:hypothetical protein
MSKEIYYKALTTQRKSWYDGSTQWRIGKPMPKLAGPKGEPCGVGYHLGKTLNDAMCHSKMPALVYEATITGEVLGEDSEKIRVSSAKITRNVTPEYIRRANAFIASIPKLKLLSCNQEPREEWMLFNTRSAAESAARSAARSAAYLAAYLAARSAADLAAYLAADLAARSAARSAAYLAADLAARSAADLAARSAALMARMAICFDLDIDQKHRDHAAAEWDVWTRGYGLVCDVGGVLYVYRRLV